MSNAATARGRVLPVEDDADTRHVMARLLTRLGCEVRAVASVGEALGAMHGFPPTHILLDLMLPDAGGVVLLESVRRARMPVRVAVVTAAGPDSPAVMEVMPWKPDVIFHKPVEFPPIEAWLQQA